jgi:hypothetical protein
MWVLYGAHLRKMSGVLRAAAPLARRLNAVPKGPVNRATRGMASDPNATPKVAYPWLDPSNPANWKEEHVVFTILGAWGVVIFGAKTAFS